jgi:hypothetical protein
MALESSLSGQIDKIPDETNRFVRLFHTRVDLFSHLQKRKINSQFIFYISLLSDATADQKWRGIAESKSQSS